MSGRHDDERVSEKMKSNHYHSEFIHLTHIFYVVLPLRYYHYCHLSSIFLYLLFVMVNAIQVTITSFYCYFIFVNAGAFIIFNINMIANVTRMGISSVYTIF